MKKFINHILHYFSPIEWGLWLVGMTVVLVSFFMNEEKNLLSLFSSLAGITCIIFNSKGNVLGQYIAIAFSILYAIHAYLQHYYGESIIYIGLMLPIHIASVITWLKHSHSKTKKEVQINVLTNKEFVCVGVGAILVTVAFYFLLQAFNTDNLIVSTISLTTSITAAYLMFRRCELFSLCFLANDIILIVLWSMKMSTVGIEMLPSVLSFVVFLATDSYSFFNWQRIKKRQRASRSTTK